LDAVYGILFAMTKNEAINEATHMHPNYIPDEGSREALIHHVPLMEQGGLIRKIAELPEFKGMDGYRITWKGFCFLDLYNIWVTAKREKDSTTALVSYVALVGLC
jgi:hypothetical protein